MIEISQTCLREKNNNRKILTKHVTRQNHIAIAKYWILKGLKGSKTSEITSLR